MKEKLVVIDGNSLLYRSFFALPQLKTKEGIVTSGIYGFLNIYYRIMEDYSPDYISIVFDKKGATFRHREYEDYKAGRAKMPDELGIQFPILKEILDVLNVKYLEADEFEADDIAGTLAKMAKEKNVAAVLVSGDKDYLQLVDENTQVVLNKKGISEIELYDIEKVQNEYGLSPNQLIDLKGLMGDKSDNIPGIPGVGLKTGIKLLDEHGSLESIYENIDGMKQSSLKSKLEMYRSQALMSKMLATIVTNVPLELEIEDLARRDSDDQKTLDLYQKYELKSLYGRVKRSGSEHESQESHAEAEYVLVSDREGLIKAIGSVKGSLFMKFAYEENDGAPIGAVLIIEDKNYYVDLIGSDLDRDFFMAHFKRLAEDKGVKKYGHNIKEEMIALLGCGVELQGVDYDAMVALYLIDPSIGNYSALSISREILKKDIPEIKSLLGTGKSKKTVGDLDLSERASFYVTELLAIKDSKLQIESSISDMNMDELYRKVELPLIEVLADMEHRGFAIDMNVLEELEAELAGKLEVLIAVIYELAGEEFNLNSPKQLSEILFEKLGLPVIKKTKTGNSTNAEVLEKLEAKHPIICKILEYRQLSKLKSTYIDGLKLVVNKDTGKIHSKFNQTITSTGRISSTDPNLQNIPIKTEEGRKIRKMFIAKNEDYKLVDADYSQIELRVLAHISGDEKLKQSFYEGTDIHRRTASEVFGVPLEEVTDEMRSRAKAVNFGIIYGISDFGLSKGLNISRKEAKKYIDSYLEKYPKVRDYMERTVECGTEKGYVETILHRRRYIPELTSRNFNIRGFGERIALNTPIQGSAADIIKVAMVEVYRKLKEKNMKSNLILQVHDELIIEAFKDELEEVKEMLKSTMENAIELSVPLKVDMKVGDRWYETK